MAKRLVSIYWSAIRPRKWLWFVGFFFHTLFFIGVFVLEPLLISSFVDALSNAAGKSIHDFVPYIWFLLGLHFGEIVLARIGIYAWFHASSKTLRDIDLMSFKTILSHGSDFFSNNFTGSLVTKFNRFTRSFDLLSTAIMFDLNSLVVQVVVPFVILLFIAKPIAFIILAWAIFYAVSLIFLHKRKISRSRAVASYDSKVTGVVADVITNALSVKMFSRFLPEFHAFTDLSNRRVKARLSNLFFGDYIRLYKVALTIILQIPVFYLSAIYALEGRMSVASIILVQLYIMQLIRSLWEFGKLVQKLEEAVADATEMAEIYDLPISVTDPKTPKKLINVKGVIDFNNVDFKYDGDNERAVFTNLNLHIPVGQKVGLVGHSGGGKTTLTKILLRFNNVTNGQILIDGQNIAEVTQDDLRSHIAYVPQEPLLFHRSIYDNIAYGDPSAKQEDVYRAAKLAHAAEFIEKLPNGYDTLVGERGIKLSGGQKQRVAIARAMLKKAPILVLDEATSALDSKSEKHIAAALDNLMKNRTTIVIAHRLSTIRKLDRILVISNGQIAEDGTHSQLLKASGIYAELWGHQQGDFLDEETAS